MAAPNPISATEDDGDAVAFLEAQHAEIRALFNQIEQAGADDKADVFQCLVRLLAAHETAEEELVHPAVRRAQGGVPIVETRLEEEATAKEALAHLEEIGVDDPSFAEELASFRRDVDRHAANEESQEFPLLRTVSDDAALAAMTGQLRLAQEVAPTHPHPHGPESAVGNLVVGPCAAIADRVRDALKGN